MFEVLVEQQKLVRGLKEVRGSVGRGKGQNVSDKTVYMRSFNDQNGVGHIELVTTNFNEWTSTVIDTVKPVVEGVAPLLEHSLFLELIETISPTMEITIKQDSETGASINFLGRKVPIELLGGMINDFVLPPEVTPTMAFTLPFALMKKGLDKASQIIVDSEDSPLWNCVNIIVHNKSIVFQALDSENKRMFAYAVAHQSNQTGKFFVECNKLRRMTSGFNENDPVNVAISSGNIAVEQNGIKAILRLVSGEFIDVLQFMPKQYDSTITFNKSEVINSLKRVDALLKKDTASVTKSCVFNMEDMFSTIQLNSSCGKIVENIVSTSTSQTPVKKAFKVEAFLDTLNAIEDSDIVMHVYPQGHVVLGPKTAQGYSQKCLLRPMQIH